MQGGGTVGIDGCTITAIAESTNTLTISTNTDSFTAGDYIVRAAHQDATFPTNGYAMMGLDGIIDTDCNLFWYYQVNPKNGTGTCSLCEF